SVSLAPGAYNVCQILTGRHATIDVTGSTQSTINVRDEVRIGDASTFEPLGNTFTPLVNATSDTIDIGAHATVRAFITAPSARLVLGNGAKFSGTACARLLSARNKVRIMCAPESSTTTSTSTPTTTTSSSTGSSSTTASTRLATTSTTSTTTASSSTTPATTTTTPAPHARDRAHPLKHNDVLDDDAGDDHNHVHHADDDQHHVDHAGDDQQHVNDNIVVDHAGDDHYHVDHAGDDQQHVNDNIVVDHA